MHCSTIETYAESSFGVAFSISRQLS